MPEAVTFEVLGEPKAQPRPKAARRGAFIHIYTPATAKEWKGSVAHAAEPFLPPTPFACPLKLELAFRFERPKSHLTSRGILTKSAPLQKTSKPDLDNLEKAVMDALTDARMWADDSQVIEKHATKTYGAPQGVTVTITPL